MIHGTVGRAAVGSQSALPPAPSVSSEWWENVASENTLIPWADSTDTGDMLGKGPFKVPKTPVFDGSDVSYPSWSQDALLSARHNNLYCHYLPCALYFRRLVVKAAGMGYLHFFREKSQGRRPCAPYHGE